ncbi:MAG: HpcH/HpaI aldolase/citrate lyase family protein [Gammaproteobacteria bacterium]
MLRSLLFAPGDSEKKMTKASGLGADCVILDLEDSVAAARKPVAREMVREFLAAGTAPGVAFYVRVNPMDSGMILDDIAAVAPAAPAGVVVPKANGPEDLRACAHYLDVLEAEHGLPAGGIRILPVATETAAAVFTLGDYRHGCPRLSGLTWGAEDLGAAVGASTNLQADKDWTQPYQVVRSLCLFAAHAAGVQAIDTVMADFRDTERLGVVCDEARRDGFTGKLCIHPAQVEVVNRAFSPSAEELAHSRAVIEAFAANPEAGTLQLDGKMIDKPHLTQAERIVALAEALEQRHGSA